MLTKFLAITLLLLISTAGAVARSNLEVIDGDTIDLDGVRYRLHGIDAPEAGQLCKSENGGEWPCGQAAIHKMESLVIGQVVTCIPREEDGYGRWIASCRTGDKDINGEMVASGLAWAFRKYSGDYVAVEEIARVQRIGIWQADTETAWDFRSNKWEIASSSAPISGCPIKGNINRKNERIYHAPWSRDYMKTKIDTRKGERWFCSEGDAVAAGWRAPQWGN